MIRTRGVTPIPTISAEEMVERCLLAAFALHAGRRVTLQPGVFRASGWAPEQVLRRVLGSLNLDLRFEGTWTAWITRRSDGSFVLQGRKS